MFLPCEGYSRSRGSPLCRIIAAPNIFGLSLAQFAQILSNGCVRNVRCVAGRTTHWSATKRIRLANVASYLCGGSGVIIVCRTSAAVIVQTVCYGVVRSGGAADGTAGIIEDRFIIIQLNGKLRILMIWFSGILCTATSRRRSRFGRINF